MYTYKRFLNALQYFNQNTCQMRNVYVGQCTATVLQSKHYIPTYTTYLSADVIGSEWRQFSMFIRRCPHGLMYMYMRVHGSKVTLYVLASTLSPTIPSIGSITRVYVYTHVPSSSTHVAFPSLRRMEQRVMSRMTLLILRETGFIWSWTSWSKGMVEA